MLRALPTHTGHALLPHCPRPMHVLDVRTDGLTNVTNNCDLNSPNATRAGGSQIFISRSGRQQ